MKQSTESIIHKFPVLEKYIPDREDVILENQVLENLDDTEQIFFKLICFFEKPNDNHFDLWDLFKTIDKDWLPFALECIITFFKNDTYLMEDTRSTFNIIKEDIEYLNQTDFAHFLNEHKKEHGMNFSRPMINTYLKRGKVPPPDLTINKNKYWLKETCERYLHTIRKENNTF